MGNGGDEIGRSARASSASSSSSPATRLVRSWLQPVHLWMTTHSPSARAAMAIGSMGWAQGERRSPM